MQVDGGDDESVLLCEISGHYHALINLPVEVLVVSLDGKSL